MSSSHIFYGQCCPTGPTKHQPGQDRTRTRTLDCRVEEEKENY